MIPVTALGLHRSDQLIKTIRDLIRKRLDQPGRYVHIRFGVIDPLGEGKWDAALGSNCGCTGGPIGKPSKTLRGLYNSILVELRDVDRRREELRKEKEADDASM